MKLLATKNFPYDNKKISKNDVFNARNNDETLLLALGWAKRMPDVDAMNAENTSSLIPAPSRVSTVSSSPPIREHVELQPVAESPPALTAPHVELQNLENEVQSLEQKVEKSILDVVPLDESSENEGEDVSVTPVPATEYSKMLRDRARTMGLRVDGRWSDERVQREIDEYNKKTYQRMDLRTE